MQAEDGPVQKRVGRASKTLYYSIAIFGIKSQEERDIHKVESFLFQYSPFILPSVERDLKESRCVVLSSTTLGYVILPPSEEVFHFMSL